MKESRGLNTAVKLTLPVASTAVCSNPKYIIISEHLGENLVTL